jgi:tRNA1(Val) A37 N6-methylase TrmN6
LEQSDIVPVLTNFQVQIDDSGELVIMNPPIVEQSEQPEKQDIETSVQ